VTELPAVPGGWVWMKLGDFAHVRLGKMLSAKARAVDLEQRPYLRNQNVRWGTLDVSDVKMMGFKSNEIARYSIEPDDLLVCEGGEPARCAVYQGPPAAFMYQKALHRVRPYPGTADPRFLQYCLWHYARNGVVLPRPSETTIQHLPLEEMLALPIPLPPLPEQRRIVEALDTHFTRLDAAVATLERVRAKLKRYRTAVLHAVVEGRLDGSQTRRSDLIDGWTWTTVGAVADEVRFGSSAKTSVVPEGVPVLRMGNIQAGDVDPTNLKYLPARHREFPDLLLRPGDLLFNRTNSAELVGKCAVFHGAPSPCSFASYLIRVRLKPSCNPEFLAYWLNSIYGRKWVKAVVVQQVGQANVNGTKLRAFRFAMPDLPTQEAIVAEVRRRFSLCDAAAKSVDADLLRCARLRQALLRIAFAGRLAPQDQRDEPASVLLDRIRTERAATSPSPKKKLARSRR
jgi:type I restriction enzyme S subunit